jgi:molybdopterin-guanine dinucleotide biosynthesis protein A
MSKPSATGINDLGLDLRSLTAVVLCSGRGRRMSLDGQGIEKGLIPLRGRPLVEHVIERLAPQVGALMLNAPDEPQWRVYGTPLVQDRFSGSLGPLAGIHAGMHASRTRWLLCVPCDAPLLPGDLSKRLLAAQRASGARCVSARAGGRSHPVFALIDVALAGVLEDYLNAGGRQVEAWFRDVGFVECEFPDPMAFTNLNTRSDLLDLEHA